jgi:Holliday junction resolvasome RuvABC DNA-binding subunit
VVYTQLIATDLDTMKALCGGPVDLVLNDDGSPKKGAPSVASAFNYGNDLNAKRTVRNFHESKTKGPEKSVNAAVKALMALGYTQAEAETVAKARQQ